MSDSVSARLSDARTLLSRAAYELMAGECRERVFMAMASIEDALEQREADVGQRRIEVPMDAAAAPGVNPE